jgi:hypothetical protein
MLSVIVGSACPQVASELQEDTSDDADYWDSLQDYDLVAALVDWDLVQRLTNLFVVSRPEVLLKDLADESGNGGGGHAYAQYDEELDQRLMDDWKDQDDVYY